MLSSFVFLIANIGSWWTCFCKLLHDDPENPNTAKQIFICDRIKSNSHIKLPDRKTWSINRRIQWKYDTYVDGVTQAILTQGVVYSMEYDSIMTSLLD